MKKILCIFSFIDAPSFFLTIFFATTLLNTSSYAEEVMIVMVSDDRANRKGGKYRETQLMVEKLFRNNPNFGITKFSMFTYTDVLKTPFYEQNKILLDRVEPDINGRVYKPLAIYLALLELKEGDFLIYADSSPELWSNVNNETILNNNYNLDVIKKLCNYNNGLLTSYVYWEPEPVFPYENIGEHTHANFTFDRCLRKMGLWDYRDSLQHASGMIVLRKSEKTLEFAREWLFWNSIDECASIGWADVPKDESFWTEEHSFKIGHRHDQSISGLLINKMHNKLIIPPSDRQDIHPYNFLQYTRRNVDYKFVDSNITNSKIISE